MMMNGYTRRIYRRGLALWSKIYYRNRHRKLTLEYVHGLPLLVLPDVFNPVIFRSSMLLAQQLSTHLKPGLRYLDMGTGCGVGAVVAAQFCDDVTALDINPQAVRCTRINAMLNCVEDRLHILESDLFTAVADETYDIIGFNPPYYHGTPTSDYDHAWRSLDTVERFAATLGNHLKPDGYALVVLSTDGATPQFLQSFADCGLNVQVVTERDLINEIQTVYRLSLL